MPEALESHLELLLGPTITEDYDLRDRIPACMEHLIEIYTGEADLGPDRFVVWTLLHHRDEPITVDECRSIEQTCEVAPLRKFASNFDSN